MAQDLYAACRNAFADAHCRYQLEQDESQQAPLREFGMGEFFEADIYLSEYDSPVLVDGAVLRVKSMRPEAELMLTSNFSSKVEITAGGCFIFEHRRSTGASCSRRWIGGLRGRYDPTRRFFINWNYNYMGFAVESAYRVPDVDDHRLDVTAGCRLLADNGLQLSVSAFDILNRTTSISSGVMQNCILMRRNVFFGRYWTFNISYKFDRKH